MGANRKPPFGSAPASASAPETGNLFGQTTQVALPASGIPQYNNVELAMAGGYHGNFHFKDQPLIYPLSRDPTWVDVSSGALSFGASSMYGDGDKFPGIEVAGFSQGGLPPFVPDAASSLTYSPPSSYQGSVWSPIQTDFTTEFNAPTGTSGSRVPSPLRNMASIPVEVEGEHVCQRKGCEAKFASKEVLELHLKTGHSHICLWGDNGPCDSPGFATRDELNWHVKREHLLLCPVPGCTEGAFVSRSVLDCHLKCAHGGATTDISNVPETTADPPGASTSESQTQSSTAQPKSVEDKIVKMDLSICISKKRCRDQLRTVLEKRAKRANGGTPRAGESPGIIRSRTPKLLESASFPIIWEHGVLPFLAEFVPKWCGPRHVISVMRGRKPDSRRICIMTRHDVSRARRLAIAGHVRDLLPESHRGLVTFVFSTGKVERMVWSRGLSKEMPDEVCLPRNPFCYTSPCMGDSIGTTSEDGDEITATLGPCVVVGGGSYWLASFHPFVDASKSTHPVSIEHPSPADRAGCVDGKHDMLSNGDLDFVVGDLTATSGFDLKTTRVSHEPYWEDCDKEPPLVVTDWALLSARTRQANLLRKFPTTNQRRETPVTSMSSVVPGATVCSTGRTSGFQRGQVCEIPAYIDGSGNGTGKASREWCIEEPYPYDNEDAWIRGGIGVEGDSGAVLVDCESNAIIGQLWGRNRYHGPGPRYTFFTPISDIFDDIQEKCSQERRPQLPQYRSEADCWPAYPICRQCFDFRGYLESRRSSRESLMSMIGMHDGRAGDTDYDLTSVSELATPKDQSYLVRHIGSNDATSSVGSVVSPAPIHAFYTVSQAMSPGNPELRSPYAQALNEDDLYEKGPDTNEVVLGKRPALLPPTTGQQTAKRRRVTFQT